ncbi:MULTISPECIES: peptide-methionine (S)-S-oxide reductase MsrA [unclassified Breznakia]|uniref:peptide-methionine (S)-S-oxide reductase MsrA n=1 Tax=unclassified Breznakia TaxID=2623764 RepID=UPI00247559C3|nr:MULTISPECIES: peptide-methionine (S)-S-oxide reductase MsrA [unclassified Breznakia]MDH6368086.1 peptide methionine sulfoxide reductase msrA/msrB [Breznakia sp. PH1-1]MDH6405182.1 peptide methionine sulfoxide reductase msrA/msrB [Breznakia sp. PF1-11]MDH6412889.1 peptide methionine sulfoxide reductase msrA/msrB [Breznakia sp. PFB1-11]MDH6415258.1 peptide methionine sulfoxide reductase msrA/msrB [Breznakia sp. PFB1-14]MDH6417560.1 peptide methionine sulfoxide reductase msrA/msrB [Breznakia s
MKEIYVAGGCFWGTEKYFEEIEGVKQTDVGYANGKTENPTYEDVCHNDAGHAETVHVTYDENVVSLPFLLDMYFAIIDPTSVNKQGNDVGSQYRTGIYYTDDGDAAVINYAIQKLQKQYDKPIAIEVEPLGNYYPAEAYHQKYLDKNPTGYCHIGKIHFAKAKSAKDPMKKDLKKRLSALQYEVTQLNATEPAYDNEYYDTFEPGIYVDIVSGEPLFVSTDKFESGCGWPSFSKPIDMKMIQQRRDQSHGLERIEVRSKQANSHLGHVFNDGPEELGGMRFCINSAALKFIPLAKMEEAGYKDLISLVKEQ